MVFKKNFWISTIFAIISFILIGHITYWKNFFYYVHVFNFITIIVFSVILYITLNKSWTLGRYKSCVIALIITAIPHIFCSFVSYGSMLCLGISVILVIFLIIKGRRAKTS